MPKYKALLDFELAGATPEEAAKPVVAGDEVELTEEAAQPLVADGKVELVAE